MNEKELLEEFINKRQKEKEFILTKGVIEDYFPAGFTNKDLDNVIELLKDPKFSTWRKTPEYQLLEKIVDDIFDAAEIK